MASDTRYQPLPVAKRCGVPGCWCTPAAPPKLDYGTRPAAPGARLVPRGGEIGEIGVSVRAKQVIG